MSRPVHKVIGPPGTGKTTRLLKEVEKCLANGIPPDRIAYLSFSRKAAREAADRASVKFNLAEGQLPWFRTLHSVAYKLLGLKPQDVMNGRHYREMGEWGGYTFESQVTSATERFPLIDWKRNGDRCLSIYALSRARLTTIAEEWRRANYQDLPLEAAEQFSNILEQYRASKMIVDFTDMLDMCQDTLPVDVLIVDEAQDLTPQQWRFARQIGKDAKEIWLAGDDDQAIYGFNGSTAKPLFTLDGQLEILPHSYRLPRAVHALASKVIGRVQNRIHKEFTPRDEAGLVSWLPEPSQVDLSKDTWMLLSRCRYGLDDWVGIARSQSVVYWHDGQWSNRHESVRAVVAWEASRKQHKITIWDRRCLSRYVNPGATPDMDWMEALSLSLEEKEYIRGLRRRKESLTNPGRVVISTVHEAKGGEAHNVAFLTDTNSLIKRNIHLVGADEEHRVLYVALTRAKQNLYLIKPRRRWFYELPA